MLHGNALYHIATLPEPVFWLWLSGLIFLAMSLTLILGPFRHERNTLMNAFLGFLVGMSFFHLLGGAAMFWNIPILMYIGTFAAVTGSAFVLKFPLSAILNDRTRTRLFYIALIIGWAMVSWLLLNSYPMDKVMAAGAVYMIVVSGLISGFYMLVEGFRMGDPSTRIKCVGGGCSIIFCCLVSHLIILTIGFATLAKVFMVLTPITLVLSLYIARRLSLRAS